MSLQFHRRYHDLHSIREHFAFRVLHARRIADDTRCVLVAPSRTGPEVREALARFAEAHRRIDHPQVPKTVAELFVGEHPVVELDCPGYADGLELFRRFTASSTRMPYPAADGFIVGLRTALQAAHRVTDPRTNGPTCLGRISGANVLFGTDGRSYLIGFGHNVCVEDELGNPDPQKPYFQAPELAFGGAPSPTGDYVALLSYMRSGIHLVDKSDAIARIVRGIATNGDLALAEVLLWIEQRVMTAVPQQRATIDESIEAADRIRKIIGTRIEPQAFEALVARSFRDHALDLTPSESNTEPLLTVGPGAEWVRWKSEPVIRLRSAMRRILLALVERHLIGSATPMRTFELGEVGWPDEVLEYESGRNRIYVTVTRLRKLLPDDLVQHMDDGYRLAPGLRVHRMS